MFRFYIILLMEKSSIQNIANSTFTSQFFNPASRTNLEKSLTAIKNSKNLLIKIELTSYIPSLPSKRLVILIPMINLCFFMQLSIIVLSQHSIFCKEERSWTKLIAKENLSSICVPILVILKYSKL